MALDVETHFVLPLIAFYDKDPSDQVREHVNARLDGVAPKDLQNAVEWLKNNRKTLSSFPAPKDCFLAVEKGQNVHKLNVKQQVHGITPDTYLDTAEVYVREHGRRCKMIEPDTEEWFAWYAYFKDRSIASCLGTMEQIKRETWSCGRFAVPARWPWDFDQSAPRGVSEIDPEPPKLVQLPERDREEFVNGTLKSLRAAGYPRRAKPGSEQPPAEYVKPELSERDKELQDRMIKAALASKSKAAAE